MQREATWVMRKDSNRWGRFALAGCVNGSMRMIGQWHAAITEAIVQAQIHGHATPVPSLDIPGATWGGMKWHRVALARWEGTSRQ